MTGLLAHLASGCTTVCRAWQARRRDGVEFGFTDHDCDLSFEGVTFRASAGISARVLSQSTGMAVDNTEAVGVLSHLTVTEEDLRAGRWDGASVTCWLVNWQDTTQRIVQCRGTIGEVAQSGVLFRAELRGLTAALNRPMGRIYQRDCAAVLGDARCKVDLSSAAFRAEATLVKVRDGGRVLVVQSDGFEEGWFAHGRVSFLDGRGAGLDARIRQGRRIGAFRQVDLWVPPAVVPAEGDRVALLAGCDRRAATCGGKFSNFINFRGFPDIPGEDWLAAYPRRGGPNDGRSRRGA